MIVTKAITKKELCEIIGIGKTTLKRWVKNAYSELGFRFGREKIVSIEKANKIIDLFTKI